MISFGINLNQMMMCMLRVQLKCPSAEIFSKNKEFKMCIYAAYKIIILCVVLYGCGIWSLTLREEHKLKV
jgi:hypothetical protein